MFTEYIAGTVIGAGNTVGTRTWAPSSGGTEHELGDESILLGIAAGGGTAAETIISWRVMAICQDTMLGEGEGNKVLGKEVAHSKAQTSRSLRGLWYQK